jgi:hypothetical protein
MKARQTPKRLPWLLPYVATFVSLLSSHSAQASLSFVITGSNGVSSYANVQAGQSYSMP